MKVITLVIFVSMLVRFARLPLFETVFGILLLMPIIFFAAGAVLFLDYTTVYYVVLGGIMLLLLLLGLMRRSIERSDIKTEVIPLALFCAGFAIFHHLCFRWPDFISIGERLRDYALLSSVLRSPIYLSEPWLSGMEMNYYGYWYRFGHMLQTLLGLEIWETYHQLNSFTFALFLACAFRLFRNHLRFSVASALFSSLLVTFGSNVAGVMWAYNQDGTWWYPSRVIPGAIHEFPIWSFVLGDAHPHYLNLPMIPFIILLLLACYSQLKNAAGVLLFALSAVAVPYLLLYSSNAWEIPIWFTLLFGVLVAVLIIGGKETFSIIKGKLPELQKLLSLKGFFIMLGLILVLASLYYGSRNFIPIDAKVRFVKEPIPRSALFDLFRHWGVPLFLIIVANGLVLSHRALRVIGGTLLFLALFCKDAILFLLVVWLLNLSRAIPALRSKDKEISRQAHVVLEVIGICSLGFLLVPELIFLDDPYGGENERMNTIFKIYSGSWFILHAFAFYLIRLTILQRWGERVRSVWVYLGQFAVLVLASSFFFVVLDDREGKDKGVKPLERGLSRVELLYPGSARAIIELSKQPQGSVLEGQGNAYAETTLIATLSNKEAYLGWANHVQLLYPSHQTEIDHRKKVTELFYGTGTCQEKRELMYGEEIRYAVVGPIEKKLFPKIDLLQYNCLSKIVEDKQYAVYSVN